MFNLSKIFGPQELGKWGEDYIAQLYRRKGYKILDKNYFRHQGKRLGEIDVVAVKDRDLVFVEVKTRTSTAYGSGLDAVNTWKQQRLVKSCKQFLQDHPDFSEYNYRIDVAELKADLDRRHNCVTILENAVEDTQ